MNARETNLSTLADAVDAVLRKMAQADHADLHFMVTLDGERKHAVAALRSALNT